MFWTTDKQGRLPISPAVLQQPNGAWRDPGSTGSRGWRLVGPGTRITLGLAGMLLAASGCRSDRTDAVRKAVPALAPEFVAHLVRDDSTAFRRYAAGLGYDRVAEADFLIRSAQPTSSLERFAAFDSALGPYIDKTKRAIATEFGADGAWTRQIAFRRRTLQDKLNIVRLLRVPAEIEMDKAMPADIRLRRYADLIQSSRQYEGAIDIGAAYGRCAELLFRLNRSREAARALDLGIESSLRSGELGMACQLLGTKAIMYAHRSATDSALACLDMGIRIAHRARSGQEARLLRFASQFWTIQGRPLVALDVMDQSTAAARVLGDKWQEAKNAIDTAWLFGRLSCWDLARPELQHAQLMIDEMRGSDRARRLDRLQDDASALRAYGLATTGEKESALREARKLQVRLREWEPGAQRERSALIVASVFSISGEHALARQVLMEVRNHCEKYSTPEVLRGLLVATATANLRMGDFVGCAQAVQDYYSLPDSLGVLNPWDILQLDVCSIDATRVLNGRAAAVDTVRAALRRYQIRSHRLGPGSESNLIAAPVGLLHESVHQTLAMDANASYAFEMAWRRSLAVPAPADSNLFEPAFSPDEARPGDVRRVVAALRETRAMHCAYYVRGQTVTRWTVYDGQAVRDTLLAPLGEIQKCLDTMLADIGGKNSAHTTSAELEAKSRQLSRWLLPESIWQGAPPSRLFVTPDGILYRVPFNLLNLAKNGFDPLVNHCDVAAVRYWRDSRAPATARTALLVTNPAYDARMRRFYPSLNNPLSASESEASVFAALIPGASILRGAEATKSRVLAGMSGAECLYFATHMLQHPRLPFLCFIPLVDTWSTTVARPYLEPADIRAVDLSRCQLVVLSGCSSAIPYVAKQAIAPGLGDAFLDGGARCVVQTLWDVQDADAAGLMRQFALEYAKAPTDPVGALGNAQRAMLARGANPAAWAAYSVAVAGVVQPSTPRPVVSGSSEPNAEQPPPTRERREAVALVNPSHHISGKSP